MQLLPVQDPAAGWMKISSRLTVQGVLANNCVSSSKCWQVDLQQPGMDAATPTHPMCSTLSLLQDIERARVGLKAAGYTL
jgi:hypothetical protein